MRNTARAEKRPTSKGALTLLHEATAQPDGDDLEGRYYAATRSVSYANVNLQQWPTTLYQSHRAVLMLTTTYRVCVPDAIAARRQRGTGDGDSAVKSIYEEDVP